MVVGGLVVVGGFVVVVGGWLSLEVSLLSSWVRSLLVNVSLLLQPCS